TNNRRLHNPTHALSSNSPPVPIETAESVFSTSKPQAIPFRHVIRVKDAQTQTYPPIPVTFPDPRKLVMEEEAQIQKRKQSEQTKQELEKRKLAYAEKLKCIKLRKVELARKLMSVPESPRPSKLKALFRPVLGTKKKTSEKLPPDGPESASTTLGDFNKMAIDAIGDLFGDRRATPTPTKQGS
ncbi:unnamed protein product, partial [Orchesella dallaii]